MDERMSVTLAQLAALVGGKVQGEARTLIYGAATLDEAAPGQITLIDRAERAPRLNGSRVAAAVVPEGVPIAAVPTIVVSDVHHAFARIVTYFRPLRAWPRTGISPSAYISPTALIADDVDIHPGATIGDEVCIGRGSVIHCGVHIMAGCRIGEEVRIFPGAVLYENTRVGSRVIIHACAVIGAYGFGYQTVDGRHRLTPQLGYVQIGDDVEIGACTTIDRGTYGATVIGEGIKIDNQVMIAHNCRLGKHNIICSQVGIAGSTTTGDYVVMAGQVGVRDHVHIGTGAVLGAKAGVSHDVPAGARMIGIPATPEREQKVKQAVLAKLPEMRQELKELRRAVAELRDAKGNPAQDRDQAAA
jgi:UDP-3-O-[3-hydroxymyristoyl] glucosamine N-acyltransferase